MKKVLALLLVCLLATSVAFAAVQFSGSLTAGVAVNYDDTRADNNGWRFYTYGDDGDDSNEMSLTFRLADDQGLWSAEVKGLLDTADIQQLFSGENGKIEAIFKTNIAKAIAMAVGGESPVDVTLEIGGDRRVTGFRAYNNASGANLDRVRTLNNISPFGVTIGYKDYVQAQVMYSPLWYSGDMKADPDDNGPLEPVEVPIYGEDLSASALIKPYSGIAVSVDYAMNGESKDFLSDADVAGGLLGGAVDINVGELIGADFNVGVSVSDRYEFGTKYNQLAAVVYGGVDMVSGYIEYALRTFDKAVSEDPWNYLNVGVDLALVENMNLNVYFGADDLGDFVNQYFVGGNIGYTLYGVKYNLGIEYNASNIGAYNYDHKGLMIVPSVSVSF